MLYSTHQATSRDWLKGNENIVFAPYLQGDIGTLSLSGSSFDFLIVFDDFSSYLRGVTIGRKKTRKDDLKKDLLSWDILSDEALKQFEADL